MKELVILSGKGGTGKTSLCAAFADFFSKQRGADRIVLVDADVDAANLDLILEARRISSEVFRGGKTALIDPEKCHSCGICRDVCRFDAVIQGEGCCQIDPIACEGCAACLYQCPEAAITMEEEIAGEWYQSETPYGRFFHAHLFPARDNSGKLVALLKTRAQAMISGIDQGLILVDGPPGIGCPVISAITGADAALIVTEPSLSGIHDLKRALETAGHFGIPSYVCVNKADIYPEGTQRIQELCSQKGVSYLGEIPYDLSVPRAMAQGLPVTRAAPGAPASLALERIWESLISREEWEWHPGANIRLKTITNN